MEKSESIKNLATALVEFQKKVGTINKDSVNPFFKSKYAALPDILKAIHQPLVDCDLAISQFPSGSNGLTTILTHAKSGEFMLETYFMTPSKNDPQGIGSSITYQRRYAIGSILSLNIDEDDDGNKASNTTGNQQTTTPPTQTAQAPNSAQQAVLDVIKTVESKNALLELQTYWKSLTPAQQGIKAIIDTTNKRKAELEKK
jgi:hypothetical protein